jgi:carbohydrate binding protein with CBM4/9 domain
MPTINATVYPDEAYVLVEADWTGTGSPCLSYAGVTRRNTVTGEIVDLRPYTGFDGDGNLLLDCCEGLWWDTEPPLNVPLEYCAVASALPTNIAQNCCFETGTAPWQVWFSSGTLATSATFAHEGTQSGLFTPSGTFVAPRFYQDISGGFEGTGDITLSAWVMSPQGWNSVWLQLDVTYADGVVTSIQSPIEILDDGEWRFLSTTFSPSQEILSAVYYFRMGGLPPNTTLFYVDQIEVTQLRDVDTTVCETVTVSSESVWLKSPLHPCNDIEVSLCSPGLSDCGDDSRVSYVGHDDDSYSPNSVLMSGPNRRRPVPVNRVRADASSAFRVLAHDCDARDAVLQANEPGDPLLFQAPDVYCIPDRYISVGLLTEHRISVDQREPFRLMTLPYVVVDRPEGPSDGVCGARIADLCDIYTSWAALAAAGLTWTQLLLGEASPNGPGQQPPAGQRIWLDVETEFASWAAVEADGTWADIRDGT